MMAPRPLAPWRQYPTLRVREAAELVGVCGRVFEREVMPHLQTREVGKTRLILTESLRRWLGETVEEAEEAKPVDARIRRNVAVLRRKVGGMG